MDVSRGLHYLPAVSEGSGFGSAVFNIGGHIAQVSSLAHVRLAHLPVQNYRQFNLVFWERSIRVATAAASKSCR